MRMDCTSSAFAARRGVAPERGGHAERKRSRSHSGCAWCAQRLLVAGYLATRLMRTRLPADAIGGRIRPTEQGSTGGGNVRKYACCVRVPVHAATRVCNAV